MWAASLNGMGSGEEDPRSFTDTGLRAPGGTGAELRGLGDTKDGAGAWGGREGFTWGLSPEVS